MAQGPKPIRPLELDVRGTASATLGLFYFSVGGNADLGIARVGAGTFALGAGAEYDVCGVSCLVRTAATPYEYSANHVAGYGRVSLHLPLASAKNVDLYPLVFAGPASAHSTVRFDDGSATYKGSDTVLVVGAGAGLSYFVAPPMFIGFEARARAARGRYDYALASGRERRFDGDDGAFTLLSVEVLFALGARL